MSDVNVSVCTPDAYKSDALVIAAGTLSFVPGFSATGLAPVTHWISGGLIPSTIRDAFAADARFTVSAEDMNWRVFAASMGLQRVS